MPAGQSDETNGALLEAFRKRQHVYEIFQDAGHAAIVFGRDNDQAVGGENRIGEFLKRLGFLRIGSRRE